MRTSITIFLLSILSLSFCKLFSQEKKVVFNQLNVESGLSSNLTTSMAIDNLGFIWIATPSGLNRFDGKSIKIYKNILKDSASIPNDIVRSIAIGKDGNLWIGTDYGISRYIPEKDQFRTFYKTSDNDLYDNIMTSDLRIDKNGIIWYLQSVDKYLCLFDPKTEKCIFNSMMSNTTPFKLTRGCRFRILDSYNRMWYTVAKNMLFCIQYENSTTKVIFKFDKNFNSKKTLNSYFSKVYEDKEHNIYITNNGLYKFSINSTSSETLEYIDIFESKIPKNETDFLINDIIEDQLGNLWISTSDRGVIVYNPKTGQKSKYLQEISKKGIQIVNSNLDKNNNIWLHANENLLYLKNKESNIFRTFSHDKSDKTSISFFNIGLDYQMDRNFILDNADIYWFNSTTSGINYFSLKKSWFEQFSSDNSNPNTLMGNTVRGIIEDHKGRIWVGANGLNMYDPTTNSWEHFAEFINPKFKYLTVSPNSILEISPNNYFVDVSSKIVWYKYENHDLNVVEEFKPDEKTPNSLAGWTPLSMYKDSKSNIWIGTMNGLSKYEPPFVDFSKGKFTNYYHDEKNPNSIPANTIWNIAEDSKHRIWLSASDYLCYLDATNKKFTTIKLIINEDTIVKCSPKCVMEYPNGTFWIATEGNGLIKYVESEKRFYQFSENIGFPTKNIYSVIYDQEKYIWMSSDRGIIRFDPSTERIEVFTKEDGIMTNEFSLISFHYGKSSKKIFFGSNVGMVAFNPKESTVSDFKPNLVFTSFKLFNNEISVDQIVNERVLLNKSINYIDKIKLKHNENIFSIEFATLHFAAPKKILYKYKLEGFDNNWITVDYKDSKAAFSGLSAGVYFLHIKSTNCDRVWSENERVLKIEILPPWWQTWWFKLLVILILFLSAFFYYKYKTYEIRQRNEELERKVALRTHEVMQQKEEIQQQAEELEATNEELTAQSDALRLSNEEMNLKNIEIEKSYKNSQIISEFGQRVTSTFDFTSINEIVYGYLQAIMPLDAFGIGLYNEKKFELEYIGFIERGKIIQNFTKSLSTENSLSSWCFNNQKVVFITDVFTEYSKYISEIPNVSTSEIPKSIIHIPLTSNTKKLGILVVNSFNINAYSQKELINIQSLASYITIALDNAEAYKTVNAQNEKLQELDKFKEGMTGMIVHDLKNPLNAIIGLSSMDLESDMMQMINSAGNQMLNLVLNILDVQKFENTDVNFSLGDYVAFSIVEDAKKQVSLLIKQKNQNLNIQIDRSVVIQSDSEIIVRVFVNILTNAIKYTPNGGTISIKLECIIQNIEELLSSSMIDVNVKDNYINGHFPICVFSVSDTGQGIPKDKQHLVFEKFGQVEAKKSGGVRSTGIGMTFCKMVIEAHGGNIWLNSEVGVGTTFYFTLPFARLSSTIYIEQSTNASADNDIQSNQNENKEYKIFQCLKNSIYSVENKDFITEKDENRAMIKILAVDDDLYSLQVYLDYLKESKFDFYYIQVIDLDKTFEIVENIAPDIVLMDWEMPRISGIDIIKQLKSNFDTQRIPVIMVTSRSANSDIQIAFDAGAIDYIRKPIEKTEIVTRINATVEFLNLIKPLKQSNAKNDDKNDDKNRISVLLIEDSLELRSYIASTMSEYYNVIEAGNGEEGFEKALEYIPDIIVSDINMPEMDGWEMCKKIRETFETSSIPIILLTAQGNDNSKIKGFEMGADDFISKPFSQEVLFSRINNIIKTRKFLRNKFYSEIFTDHTILCKTDKDENFLSNLNVVIERNISNPNFDADQCSLDVMLSKSHLYKKVLNLTGLSFNIYLRTYRLKSAAKMLRNSNMLITEVAYNFGFSSLSYFSRCFTEQFGISPTEFIKLA